MSNNMKTIKDKTEKVFIQVRLLDEIIEKVKIENDKIIIENINLTTKEKKAKLKIDILVKIISLFNSIPYLYRGEEDSCDIVNLDSTVLKDSINDNYKYYISFLIDFNFIEIKTRYSTNKNMSFGYSIIEKYLNDNLITYNITDKTLIKKMNSSKLKKRNDRMKEFCQSYRPHLLKIFNENLTISLNDSDDDFNTFDIFSEYSNSMNTIREINDLDFSYSIKPSTDNRLHTTLTRSSKKIRKHILYNGERIIGLDLKTSQLYFFCSFLKAIYHKDEKILESIGAGKLLDKLIVHQLFHLNIDKHEITNFVLSVLKEEKDFFIDFSKKLTIKKNNIGQPIRLQCMINKKNKKYLDETYKEKSYKNERELSKRVIMEIFYTESNSKIAEASIFKKEYPSIHTIIMCIKDYGVKFWQLLDHIEAYCLLDYAAKKFDSKHPDIHITSIHDCIVAQESKIDLIRDEFTTYLIEITTLKLPPKFEIEDWENE
jgi:hypothetical protein